MLQVIAWVIAPMIIFLMRRQSRFMAFHALQALFLQAVLMRLCLVTTVGAFAAMILALLHARATAHARSLPSLVAMFVFFPLVGVFWRGEWVINIVLAIVYGLKSSRGEWAEYPVISRLVRRLAHV